MATVDETERRSGREPTDPEPGSPTSTKMPRWVPRAIVLFFVVGVLAIGFYRFLGLISNLIIWVIIALFVSFAVEPAVNWLAKRGWRRGAATALVLFGVFLAVVVLVGAMVPLLVQQTIELIDRTPELLGKASGYTRRWFGVELSTRSISDSLASFKIDVSSIATTVAGNALGLLSAAIGAIFQMFTIGLFTFYLVADGPRLRRAICSVLPRRHQEEVLRVWEIAVDKTGGYLYSRLLLAFLNGGTAFIVLTILGVPYALPLALFQGVISQFVPVVGTYIAAALPILVALLDDPVDALIYLVFVVLYQQLENYLLSPRISKETMALHPAIAFAAAIIGASLGGIAGALLALPAAAIIQAAVSAYITRHDVVESEHVHPESPEEEAASREQAKEGRRTLRDRFSSRGGADDAPPG